MSGWGGGYTTDTTYAIAWQAAQTPAHIGLVCALAGVDWPPRRSMVVADIGCGRGFTAGVLAAASPGWQVIGLDHNPAHIAEARELAAAARLPNATFIEADLGSLADAAIDALPPLDVVMLHGVWTWVSDAVRAGIVRVMARRLKPGGIAYIGYNALPASAEDYALQRLLAGFAAEAGGSSAERMATAVARLRGCAATAPRWLAASPMLARLLDPGSGVDPAFLAHEFLTDHWRPVFHADLCADLAPARLGFVGSANLFENRPAMVFTAAQAALGGEVMKDLCLVRNFRADVFQRGRLPIAPALALGRIVLAACGPLPHRAPRMTTPQGDVSLAEGAWAALAAALSEGPQPLAVLAQAAATDPADLLVLLDGAGLVLPVAPWGGSDPEAARRFNRAAAARHGQAGPARGQLALAAPLCGGGLACSPLDLALVGAVAEMGPHDPAALAARLRPDLPPHGQARAAATVASMLADRFRVWRRLGIL